MNYIRQGNSFHIKCSISFVQNVILNTFLLQLIPRRNDQVERINKIVITLLSKLCEEDIQNWYNHVNKVQQCTNTRPPRSTKYSSFRILTGCEMRTDKGKDIRKMIEEFAIEELQEQRENSAKSKIAKIQAETRKTSNRTRIRAPLYEETAAS